MAGALRSAVSDAARPLVVCTKTVVEHPPGYCDKSYAVIPQVSLPAQEGRWGAVLSMRHLDWRDWFRELYEREPWEKINRPHRCHILRLRIPVPDTCGDCGESSGHLRLFSLSGKWLDDDSDYIHLCHKCSHLRKHPPGEYTKAGDCVKPWAELTRASKVERIKRALPKPGVCKYCDNTGVVLVSRSGEWPEHDITDYVWVCRVHAGYIAELHRPPAPAITEPLDPELFPWWYNHKSMSGTFQGHSILNKNCAFGRFG